MLQGRQYQSTVKHYSYALFAGVCVPFLLDLSIHKTDLGGDVSIFKLDFRKFLMENISGFIAGFFSGGDVILHRIADSGELIADAFFPSAT